MNPETMLSRKISEDVSLLSAALMEAQRQSKINTKETLPVDKGCDLDASRISTWEREEQHTPATTMHAHLS